MKESISHAPRTTVTIRKEILSPEPLRDIEDLCSEIKPRPKYLGPGYWYRMLTMMDGPRKKHTPEPL